MGTARELVAASGVWPERHVSRLVLIPSQGFVTGMQLQRFEVLGELFGHGDAVWFSLKYVWTRTV